MINLYLSSDGKHTVQVSAETPEKMAQVLPKAKVIYEAVVREYGTKAEMWREANKERAVGTGGTELPSRGKIPLCPVHHRPMVHRQGRYGAFWSCPERTPSGRWCPVTKDASEPDTGSAVATR